MNGLFFAILLTILLFSSLTYTYTLYPYIPKFKDKSSPPSVILSSPEDQAILSPNVTFQYETINLNGIRNASLYLNGIRNQTIDYLSLYYNDTDRVWAEKLKQRVNSTCPLSITYNEKKRRTPLKLIQSFYTVVFSTKSLETKPILKEH